MATGTLVEIELVDGVSAKLNHRGDDFSIRLAKPLVIDGQVVLRSGDLGRGEVVDAAPAGLGGKGAKLILAARYVKQDGVRVPLRSLRLAAAGHDNTTEALVVTEFVSVVGMAVKGGNVEYPAGTLATAKVAADVDLAPVAAERTATNASPPSGQPSAANPNGPAPANAPISSAGPGAQGGAAAPEPSSSTNKGPNS